MARPSPSWVNAKLAEVAEGLRVARATDVRSDWRKKAHRDKRIAELLAEEGRLRRMLPPEPAEDLPF